MTYFVTGATGFIGQNLVSTLLAKRKGKIYVLVREGSQGKLDAMKERWGKDAERVIAITGDLSQPALGVSTADVAMLHGKIKHMFHLAAVYDLKATAQEQQVANIDGTRHAVQFAEAIAAGVFHHTSSIAAAGLYDGVFSEDMFDEATKLDHPYFKTKHDSEGIVRRECKRPWRVYRPGIVVGHSKTGEIDKIDGPYYFFKLIQKMRKLLPPWMPAIGLDGGRINIVPVDYVVAAMDHLAHLNGQNGKCFHLTDPNPKRVGEVLAIFAEAAHAPKMTVRVNPSIFGFIPSMVRQALTSLTPVRRIRDAVMKDLGLPTDMFRFVNYPTRFDCRETQKALAGSGIAVPELGDYAWRLWDYWERHLDPDLFIDRSLTGVARGKNILITGGSSGIGQATAMKLAAAGAHVIIVARDMEKLEATKKEIESMGGKCFVYSCDLSNLESIDGLAKKVLDDHGHVDVLINNAGRSIRRAIENSYDRFHDFERTMQLNYFGCLRLTLALLPSMSARKQGHVINISSIGVLTNSPRFSAYVASKAALDAFTRCAASEYSDRGIYFTTVNMPLVRTPMIAPTEIYKNMPFIISPDEAADMLAQAVIYKPVRVASGLGIFGQIVHAVAPRVAQIIMNTAYRMFPDSSAAQTKHGEKVEAQPLTADQMAFIQIMKGIHL
ncbi:SDR family oxidoreductase [Parachitinimonas caeni]|uniref:SDR family oxidoreductase n=1 Tax=Parachitinimonas caeni TaxID=3031301 RepID=A0ABT7E378_9NEIS|nr:SDR family oxidoreductase [Parachitinimonas caeni]MDK2126782.1 SDR family oxidoreductase [Parachitinimonas caeni]